MFLYKKPCKSLSYIIRHNIVRIIVEIILSCAMTIGILALLGRLPIQKESAEEGIHVDTVMDISGKYIKSSEIYPLIYSKVKHPNLSIIEEIYCFDGRYFAPDIDGKDGKKGINDLMLNFDNSFWWEKSKFDCDKFSRIFVAFSILSTLKPNNIDTIVSIGVMNFSYVVKGNRYGHSVNIAIFLDDKGNFDVRVIEPQLLTSNLIRNALAKENDIDKKDDLIWELTSWSPTDYFNTFAAEKGKGGTFTIYNILM